MIYLLDTNIISESIKPKPNQGVMQWLSKIPSDDIMLSVLTIGEIRKGIEKISDKMRKQTLTQWLEIELIKQFQNRLIDIDKAIADKWGYLCGQTKTPVPAVDALIAASALTHNLKIVTRNVKDFQHFPGLEIVNPWL